MKLTLESLQVLDAIDRRGSFAAAAEEMHRVPSAITYSIQQLEEALDVLLFDRRGHRAKLTEAGRELLEEGRQLLRAAADLECRVRQVAKGWEAELRIAVTTLVGLEKLYGIVAEFYEENTGTRLRLLQEVLGGTWDAMSSGRADLAIDTSGIIPTGGAYTARPLGRFDMLLVAAPFHPLAKAKPPVTEAMLLEHRAVRIAVTTLVGLEKLYGIVAEFYEENTGTRLRLLQEVLGGTWDAMSSGRADLAIDTSGIIPTGGAYTARPLGRFDMLLVAAPFHPLAKAKPPVTEAMLLEHRAVSIADSSRLLPPRTAGLLSGQDVLTVATLEAKVAAHVAGLGVGWLPRWIAEREAWAGRLAILEPEAPRPPVEIVVAWRPASSGKAVKWFVKRLEDPLVAASLMS